MKMSYRQLMVPGGRFMAENDGSWRSIKGDIANCTRLTCEAADRRVVNDAGDSNEKRVEA
jgi:hypothetical protein